MTAIIQATDEYEQCQAQASVNVTPRDRNVAVAAGGSSTLNVELDNQLTLTEEHHGYQ